MLNVVLRRIAVVLSTVLISSSLHAQEYDPQTMCTQAAEGLLPDDAATYIENCMSDYRANMGIEQAEPIQAEPIQVEPIQAEPIQAEPIQAEPIQAEPIQTPDQLDLTEPDNTSSMEADETESERN